jgi:coatomer protein complex subunit gamma
MKSLVKTGYDNYQKSRSRGEDEGDILKTITKNGVLMESRTFNDSQLIPKRCRSLLAKIVYLINQGEKFSESESTTLFFSITKLF